MKKVAVIMCNNMHMDIEKANNLLNKIESSKEYEIETDYTKADIIIIITCAFGNGKVKTMQILADVEVNKEKNSKIILTGCLIKTNLKELKKVSNSEMIEFSKLLEMFSSESKKKNFIKQNKLIISSGCNKNCSYCVYPIIAGEYKSKPKEQIFEELSQMYENENTIYITGELETSDYGIDIYGKNYDIGDLIKDICTKFPNCNYIIGWFHPLGLTEKFISVLKECKNIVEIMVHIQHSSEKILKDMNRPKNSFTMEKLIEIKTMCPHISISTKVIVGFPKETQEDFNNLVEVLDKGIFNDIGIASYEKISKTKSSKMTQIPFEIKNNRMEYLLKRYKNTTPYPACRVRDEELESIYRYTKKIAKTYKGQILNSKSRQKYKYIAGVDTDLKVDFENTIYKVSTSILNARDELEMNRLKAEIAIFYTIEFRCFIFKLICNSMKKSNILEKAKWILSI